MKTVKHEHLFGTNLSLGSQIKHFARVWFSSDFIKEVISSKAKGKLVQC